MTLREENEVFRKGSLSFSVSYIKTRFIHHTEHRFPSERTNGRCCMLGTVAVFVRIIQNTQNILCVDKTDIFVLNLAVSRPTATTRLYFNHVRLIFV